MTASATDRDLADRLRAALGDGAVSDRAGAYAIDGEAPALVCQPATQSEVGAALAVAHEASAAVAPWGGGTHMALGMPPTRYDLALDLRRLLAVVEYEPADLTVTVEAGIPLRDLQVRLAERGQWLPLDPAVAAGATIGGVLATNASGPARVAHGSARDLVIGMSVATAEGKVVKSGGRVVKNVAGYDMAKLHIGAMGTLGVILQVTFKVTPLPQRTATLEATCGDAAAAFATASAVAAAGLALSGLAISSMPSGGWRLSVRFAGSEAAVERSRGDASAMAARSGLALAEARSSEDDYWRHLATLGGEGVDGVLVRLSCLPTDTERRTAALAAAGGRVFSLPGLGSVRARFAAEPPLAERLLDLRRDVASAGGALVVEAAPAAFKRGFDVWGEPRADFALMRRLKQEMDARAVLNPGRYLGGL